jgi:hypothetical protein
MPERQAFLRASFPSSGMRRPLQTEVKCASPRSLHLKEWKWSARVSLSHQGSDRDAKPEET